MTVRPRLPGRLRRTYISNGVVGAGFFVVFLLTARQWIAGVGKERTTQVSAKPVPIPPSHPAALISSSPRYANKTRTGTQSADTQKADQLLDFIQVELVRLDAAQKAGRLENSEAARRREALRRVCQTAYDAAQAATLRNPRDREAWMARVAALYYMGEYPSANTVLHEAQRQFPADADFAPLQALIQVRLGGSVGGVSPEAQVRQQGSSPGNSTIK